MKNVVSVIVSLTLTLVGSAASASPLKTVIASAEQQLGGQAIAAELFREGNQDLVEVELLRGNQIVEAVFDADTAALVESEVLTRRFRVLLASRAVNVARLTLAEAIDAAEAAVGGGEAVDAELVLRARKPRMNGRRYNVDVVTDDDDLDVLLNSRNGNTVRIIPD